VADRVELLFEQRTTKEHTQISCDRVRK